MISPRTIVLTTALCNVLTACGGGGSDPTSQPVPAAVNAVPTPASAITPTLYKGHGVFAPYTGLEPTAIVENGLLRLWYTAEDNSGASGAYPFKNVRIAYREASAAAFAASVKSGSPIAWTGQGDCVPGLMHSSVARDPDGTYWMSGATAANSVDLWSSSTGYPGTWTLAKAGMASVGIPGNTWMNWSGDHWDVWVEYQAANIQWRVSYWTGPTLDALTEQNGEAMVGAGGTTTSAGQVVKTTAGYAKFGHDSLTSAPTPTDISVWSSTAPGSGWTQKAWVLRLADQPGFMGDPAQPFNGDSQLADPTVVEIDGATFILYETIRQELYDVPSLSVAWWNQPLAGVTASYGVTQ